MARQVTFVQGTQPPNSPNFLYLTALEVSSNISTIIDCHSVRIDLPNWQVCTAILSTLMAHGRCTAILAGSVPQAHVGSHRTIEYSIRPDAYWRTVVG